MAPCPKCASFTKSLDISEPREYLGIARHLIEVVNEGTFLMVHATCPLQDLFSPEWPGSVVEHAFLCTGCGRNYQLYADTFHGRASWDVLERAS
jgi:transposase-like protein